MTARSIGTEVSCDGPDASRDCPESAAISASFGSMTAAEVRADGRDDGWTRRRRNDHLVDLCPACKTAP
jgi:hypothetical protein